jgi:hypothetical protein
MSLGKANSRNDTKMMFEPAIDVHLDKSDLQITTFLEFRLFNAYENFNKKLLRRFEMNENLENLPVKFEKPFYGSLMSDFKNSIAPATILK